MFHQVALFLNRLFGRRADEEGHAGPLRSLDEDRRVWVRTPCDQDANYQPMADAGSVRLPALIRNISRVGISLLLDRSFPRGTLLDVDLAAGRVLVCVAHTTPQTGGRWAVGGTFVRELTDAELQTLGARRERSSASDKRTWMRFASGAGAVYCLADAPEGTWWAATVTDISPTGIGLLAARSVAVGKTIKLKVQDAGGHSALSLTACVVRVTNRLEGDCAFGCTFMRELTDAEFKSLWAGGGKPPNRAHPDGPPGSLSEAS